MKLAIVSAWYNEEILAPFFLRHYDYVDEIHIILDTATTDKTPEILAADKRVIIHPMTYPDGLDWILKQEKVNEVYHSLDADWVFAVDADEFLYKKGERDIKAFLSRQTGDIMWTRLWQVYRHETDKDLDPSKPLLMQRRHGDSREPADCYYIPYQSPENNLYTPSAAYIKPIVIRGGKDPQWDCGCHQFAGKDVTLCTDRMDGAHWHMADPELAIKRRIQTKERQGKRNLEWGLGVQNHHITEGEIKYECWLHRTEPLVIFPEVSNGMVSIIIPCFNQLAYTQQCIESVQAFTPEDHEIIFIDNGSTDGTAEWIMGEITTHPNYRLIQNTENKGFPIACNQGAAITQGEYILLLNNDTVVSKDWLTGLLDAMKSADDIACVGPRTNYISGPQVEMNGTYDSLYRFQDFAATYRQAHRGLYHPFWRIVGFCLLTKSSIWNELGGFDEQFSPGNFEDDDYCLRACMAGYRNLICCDVFIHHHGSVTCSTMDFGGLLDTNKKKFDAKWDARIGKSISAVLIVKDEYMNIGSCITHLYHDVDEIIVVDTGSKDRTKEIAAGAGDKVKVYDFPWCDDFSAARNFANSKATCDWIFSVDADEEVTGLGKINLKPFHAYRIVTRNYNNNPRWTGNVENEGKYPQEKGLRWFPSTKVRLWPNDKRVHFQYPVHEVVENTIRHLGMQEVEVSECVVHHYGRLDDNYEYGRGDKYWQLLHKQLESGVDNLRSLEQLALQAQSIRKFEDARKFWTEIMALQPSSKTALLNMGHCYAEEGNWKEALIWSRKALDATPDSKEAAMNTATCECMAGDRAVAVKMCEDLIAKYPTYPLPQGLLNALKFSEQQNNLKESEHDNLIVSGV